MKKKFFAPLTSAVVLGSPGLTPGIALMIRTME